MNKTGPNRNYFSIQLDRGLILTKVRGSYAKVTGEAVSLNYGRWIYIQRLRSKQLWFESRPSVSDRVAGGFGRAGRRRCSRSAAVRGRGAAGVSKSGAPGVKSPRVWVGWTPRIMRDPLGRFPGFGEVRCADAAAKAALRPEVRRRACPLRAAAVHACAAPSTTVPR